MLKRIYILIVFVFASLSSYAQPPGGFPDNFFGVYAGANISGFSGNYEANIEVNQKKSRIRGQIGAFGKITFTRRSSFFVGVSYLFQGMINKNTESQSATVSVSYIAKVDLSSLSFPLLYTYTPQNYYGFQVGPQADLTLSAKEPWNRSNVVQPPDYQEDVSDKFQPVGISLAIGAYYLFPNQTSVHARFAHAVMPYTKKDYGNAFPFSFQVMFAVNLVSD